MPLKNYWGKLKMANKEYDIETSLTLDYRRLAWGLERMALDGVSNHLSEDSKGTNLHVKVKQEGRYVDLKEFDAQKPAEEVVMEDDGSGYHSGLLSVLFSTKANNLLSVGQFGEGLKMIAAAALRNGIALEYKSRNWTARPFAKPEKFDEHDMERLCFHIVENGDNIPGSRTTFKNPTPEFMREIAQLPQKVLAFNEDARILYTLPREGIIETYRPRIIDLGSKPKGIFVKGIKVQEGVALFSYDLGTRDITPDRAFIQRDSLIGDIWNVLQNCSSSEVMERILRKGNEEPLGEYIEYYAFGEKYRKDSEDEDKMGRKMKYKERDTESIEKIGLGDYRLDNLLKSSSFANYIPNYPIISWGSEFRRIFGEKAVIASEKSDMNRDAELLGYKPIKMQNSIANYLIKYGEVLSVHNIQNEREYKWINEEDLTDDEKRVFRRIKDIDEIVLGKQSGVNVKVYSGAFLKSGREVESNWGVQVTEKNGTKYIGIKRKRLAREQDFAETYLHELGHHETGAEDYDRRFTEFFVIAAAKLSVEKFKKVK